MTIKEIEVKTVLSKSNLPVSDYAVNPYVSCLHACKYCYASFMKRFTNHPEPWGTFLDVKTWPEVKDPSKYKGKELFLSSVTDPYQPHEAKYKRTRAILEQMQGSGCKISISTKSDLILRDLDLIKTFPNARVSWSINTLDDDFQKAMDKGVSIERRLEAMRQFYEAGVQTTCFISPIFPGITDVQAIIERAKHLCNLVWLENLNLRGDYRPVILDWIHENHPELDGLYHSIYSRKDRSYWTELDQQLREYTAREGMVYVRDDDSKRSAFGQPPVVANYFYHEEVKKSAKRPSRRSAPNFKNGSRNMNRESIDISTMCSHLQKKLFEENGIYHGIWTALQDDPELTAVVRSRQLHIYRNGKKVLVLAGKAAPKVIREDELCEMLPKVIE